MMLSSCATAAIAPPSEPAAAAAAPAPTTPSRIGQLLAAAGRPNAPTQADIERAMGAADITRHDGAGVALTYRLDRCALLLVFSADAQNQMRLSDAHPSARNAGEASPTVEQCAAEAMARHS
ncbi:MAG TPA: hypothetical protein VHC73_08030 [Vitreimonas sp.]|nr:hypothetical protein [Vitreimonas sp.]